MKFTRSLAVFDLDGTLVDAFADIQAAVNHAMQAQELPTFDLATIRGFVGNGMRKLCERALAPAHLDKLDVVLRETRDYYAAHPADHAFLYDGMREAVRELRTAGWKTAVLSNKPDYLVQEIADALAFRDLFDGIAGERPGLPLKPNPEALFQMARNLDADRIVMIGDGEPDGQVARNAGAGFVGVAWGIGSIEMLELFGAVASKPEELPRLIGKVGK